MSNRGKRVNNGNNGENNKTRPLEEQVAILERQVKELKTSYKKDVGTLKAALQVAHEELTASNADLKNELTASNTDLKSFKTDVDLLHRMTHELHTLCQRNAAAQEQGSFPTIEKLKEDKESSDFADALGPVPSLTEYRLQEIEKLLNPLKQDLHILSDATRDSSPPDEENPNEPKSRFLNLGNLLGEEGDEIELETDIFSILLISKTCSPAFFYPLMIAVSQYTILSLILIDLLGENDLPRGVRNDNIANVPINVSPQVAAAQFISLIIAFVTVDDMITSAKMFLNGYDSDIQKQNPGSSYCKFILANAIRFFEGFYTIALCTLMIIQADNVLDIFMNFAAVAFVSELDNLAFDLAENGLCGKYLEASCEKVQETKMKVQARGNCLGWVFNVFFVMLFLPYLAILTFIRLRQLNGYYLSNNACNNLEVQFGDETLSFEPNVRFSFVGEGMNKTLVDSSRRVPFLEERPHELLYQHFCGVYEAEELENSDRLREFNRRPVYWERGLKDPTSGVFYYCDAIKSWVFSIEALYNTPGAMPEEAREECPPYGWLLQSPSTTAMTLEEAPTTRWNIWTGSMGEASRDFNIECIDCERNSDCGLTHGTCDQDTSTCICNENWQGNRCQEAKPFCPALVGLGGDSSSDYFEIGPYSLFVDIENNNEPLLIYERPAYAFPWIFGEDYFVLEINMYTGRRWFAVYFDFERFMSLVNIGLPPHGYWDNLLSAGTNEYSEPTESYDPIGVEWHTVRPSRSRGSFGAFLASYPISWRMECIDVDCMDDDSICGYHGTCVEGFEEPRVIFGNLTIMEGFSKTYCKCDNNYGGHFCEYAPNGEYSGSMYEDYLLDPVAYYNDNNETEYLRYWTNHTTENGAGGGEL